MEKIAVGYIYFSHLQTLKGPVRNLETAMRIQLPCGYEANIAKSIFKLKRETRILTWKLRYYFKYNAALCRLAGNVEMKALVCSLDSLLSLLFSVGQSFSASSLLIFEAR